MKTRAIHDFEISSGAEHPAGLLPMRSLDQILADLPLAERTALSPSRRGRRPINDAAALLIMAQIVASSLKRGEPANERDAARETVCALGLASSHVAAGSVEDRLRGKFRRYRSALMRNAALRFNSQ